jgi:hypothetical protein
MGFGADVDFYDYVGDDPIDYMDPFGLDKQRGPGQLPQFPHALRLFYLAHSLRSPSWCRVTIRRATRARRAYTAYLKAHNVLSRPRIHGLTMMQGNGVLFPSARWGQAICRITRLVVISMRTPRG